MAAVAKGSNIFTHNIKLSQQKWKTEKEMPQTPIDIVLS